MHLVRRPSFVLLLYYSHHTHKIIFDQVCRAPWISALFHKVCFRFLGQWLYYSRGFCLLGPYSFKCVLLAKRHSVSWPFDNIRTVCGPFRTPRVFRSLFSVIVFLGPSTIFVPSVDHFVHRGCFAPCLIALFHQVCFRLLG